MKKALFLTVAVLFAFLLSANVNAQMPSAEDMAKQETESMKALGLNADQLTKVEAINLKYAQKMSEMFSQGPGGDFSEIQKKMTEMDAQKRAEFEKILTADQLKKYDELAAARRANMGGGPM